jgi:nucleoid-associated protein EbfC
MFKGLGNLATLLKQAQNMGSRMQEMGEELKRRRTLGTAGGNMVEIEINGLMEVLRAKIDPTLISGGDCELIEDLVSAAVNQAISKAKQLHAETLREVTGGMELPGLSEAMAKFLGETAPGDPPRTS